MKTITRVQVPMDGSPFVVVWNYDGQPWAERYRWVDNALQLWLVDAETWENYDNDPAWSNGRAPDAIFMVVAE